MLTVQTKQQHWAAVLHEVKSEEQVQEQVQLLVAYHNIGSMWVPCWVETGLSLHGMVCCHYGTVKHVLVNLLTRMYYESGLWDQRRVFSRNMVRTWRMARKILQISVLRRVVLMIYDYSSHLAFLLLFLFLLLTILSGCTDERPLYLYPVLEISVFHTKRHINYILHVYYTSWVRWKGSAEVTQANTSKGPTCASTLNACQNPAKIPKNCQKITCPIYSCTASQGE
jgi:hypothetical protein